MGASLVYLDKPNKEIEFTTGENKRMKFCAGEMQGWRLNMVRYSCSLPEDGTIVSDCLLFSGRCPDFGA